MTAPAHASMALLAPGPGLGRDVRELHFTARASQPDWT